MSVLEQAIGWLAPPQCLVCGAEGAALCSSCRTSEIISFGGRCWRCSALSPQGRACASCRSSTHLRAVWISSSYEEIPQQLVQLYKFDQLRATADSLAEIMIATLKNSLSDGLLAKQDYLIVPVPTATKRVRQRGFDHSLLLAKKIAQRLHVQYSPALGRLGQGRQLGSARAERLTQPAGNYFVNHPTQISGRNILLIDDVITTGGSITECAKVLRAAGVRHVDALVFAKKL